MEVLDVHWEDRRYMHNLPLNRFMERSISPPPTKRRRPNTAPANDTKSDVPDTKEHENDSHSLRIYAWNINGIAPFLTRPITTFFNSSVNKQPLTEPWVSLRDNLRRWKWPHLLLLQEVKISPSDTVTQRSVSAAVAAAAGSDEPGYEAFFTLPTDPHNAKGWGRKVYGVCSIVRSDFVKAQEAKVRTVDWDREGRFSIVETAGLLRWPKLSIWNVYAVNGTEFEYYDSVTGKVAGSRHDRKLEVQRFMTDECMQLEREGYELILAGDMNVARDERDGYPRLRTSPKQHRLNRHDFVQRFFDDPDGLRAIDTFRHLHDTARRYTYYPRSFRFGDSCDRVDYVICSGSLGSSLKEAGMLDSEKERGPSDHVPVFANFSFDSTPARKPSPAAADVPD